MEKIQRAWSGWQSIGGNINYYQITVGTNSDGHLEVFAIGNGELKHCWQNSPQDINNWSSWHNLGGNIYEDKLSRQAVGRNSNGSLEVFADHGDRWNHFVHNIWQYQGGPQHGWSNWHQLSGDMSTLYPPIVASNSNGSLEVFAVDEKTKELYHTWQHSGGWSNWYSLGGYHLNKPVIASNENGTLEVFVQGRNYTLYHIRQTSPNNGWSGWMAMPQIAVSRDIAVGVNYGGRLEVFTVPRQSTNLWHTRQRSINSPDWNNWENLGGAIAGRPAVGLNRYNQLEVFVEGTNRTLYRRVQKRPDDIEWSDWESLGPYHDDLLRPPAIGRDFYNDIILFKWEGSTPTGGNIYYNHELF
jgi:hypothetical protein